MSKASLHCNDTGQGISWLRPLWPANRDLLCAATMTRKNGFFPIRLHSARLETDPDM